MKNLNNNSFIFYFVLIHAAVTLISYGIISFYKTSSIFLFNFLIGSLISALVVSSLVVVLKGILYQKSVALPLGVIVFKYAFTGILIHMLSGVGLIENLPFVTGVSVLMISFLILGSIYQLQQKHN